MLDELSRAFDTQYARDGDKLILDNYVPSPGDYLYVHNNGKIEHCRVSSKSAKEIKENPVDTVTISNPALMRELKEKDYYSGLLEMNKPIDKDKQIHSNNYLTFWIKQNLLKDDKKRAELEDYIIDGYYSTLSCPENKYSKSNQSLELLKKFQSKYPNVLTPKIEDKKNWIKENLFRLEEVLKKQNITLANDNTYLKIFFEGEIEEYKREGKRYLIPNIYNSNDYNIRIGNDTFGIPNNSISMNPKKPYLFNRSRPNSSPFLVDEMGVLHQKKLFDFLRGFYNRRKYILYFDKSGIYSFNNQPPQKYFKGYYTRLQLNKKSKQLEIGDFDLIPAYNPQLIGFRLIQVIPIPLYVKSKLIFEKKHELYQLEELLNDYFFNDLLIANYFIEQEDIKIEDLRIREELLKIRQPIFTWIYKGDSRQLEKIFEKSLLNLIKNSIFNGNRIRAIEQFNIRVALQTYFNGGDVILMKQEAQSIYQELWRLANEDKTGEITSERMYYFAIGQLAAFFLSKNKTADKTYSMSNPILNAQNDHQIKDQLKRLFKKYNYDIHPNKRFANMMAMVMDCEPEDGKVDQEYILVGYLYTNIIYQKTERQEVLGGVNNEQAQ